MGSSIHRPQGCAAVCDLRKVGGIPSRRVRIHRVVASQSDADHLCTPRAVWVSPLQVHHGDWSLPGCELRVDGPARVGDEMGPADAPQVRDPPQVGAAARQRGHAPRPPQPEPHRVGTEPLVHHVGKQGDQHTHQTAAGPAFLGVAPAWMPITAHPPPSGQAAVITQDVGRTDEGHRRACKITPPAALSQKRRDQTSGIVTNRLEDAKYDSVVPTDKRGMRGASEHSIMFRECTDLPNICTICRVMPTRKATACD